MQKYRYIILGAGPAGLGFAHMLKDLGMQSFLVVEKEAVAGGLCRSEEVDGAPLDIGGGHFLDLKRPEVLKLLFRFMKRSEWTKFKRISKINLRGTLVDYPLEANLWQLSLDDQLDFIESIAQAGCVNQLPMPDSFEEWISWKLGKRIAEEYMLPYNRKLWSADLNELGTYWLHKLPDVSFRKTLKSCIEKKASASFPAHQYFLYPRNFGYGEVWKRMGAALKDKLITNTPVTSIDIASRTVNGCFKADRIITTIPWTSWLHIADVPREIRSHITKLQYASIDIEYHAENHSCRAHWLYEPDESLPYHRMLFRNMFCRGSRGHWTETNSSRAVARIPWRYRNEYAYPLNTRKKPEAIMKIIRWAEKKQIFGLGRWGTWEHINSDDAVSAGMEAAMRLCRKEN